MVPLYMMIGGWEWIIVLVVVAILIFAGGNKIPELARGLGKARGELKRGKKEVEKEIEEEEEELEKTSSSEGFEDVKTAAESLDIDTEGKSEEDLKEEITRTLEE